MTIASELLHRHLQTLVEDPAQWQTLIADDLVWELPYAPALGHPARLSGRAEVVRHVAWFLGEVVLGEEGWNNADSIGADELLHQADQLREQVFLAPLPALLHLVIDVARRLENNPLGTKLAGQTF
jgi:hypothetical protein